jgi:hypothetical protein
VWNACELVRGVIPVIFFGWTSRIAAKTRASEFTHTISYNTHLGQRIELNSSSIMAPKGRKGANEKGGKRGDEERDLPLQAVVRSLHHAMRIP